MTVKMYAKPYDITASGFYFSTAEEYRARASANRNSCGQPVEEYEIQFIDGERLDCELAKAWGLHQGNFAAFLEKADEWDDEQKTRYIIAVGECGADHAQLVDDPDSIEIDIYRADTMAELAEQLIDEGYLDEIPEHLVRYIDYDAIARDLAIDYAQAVIDGQSLIYCCA